MRAIHECSTNSEKLRSLADPAVAASSLRFFKKEHAQGDVFLGLRAATLHQLAKEYRELPINEVETFLHSDIHEERMLALLILVWPSERRPNSTRKQIHDFYLGNTRYVNNWDLVDASAPSLVGAYLMDKSRKPLYRLAKSTSSGNAASPLLRPSTSSGTTTLTLHAENRQDAA